MRKIIILSLIVAGLLSGCRNEPTMDQQEMPAVPVIAAKPVVKDITVYLEAVGTLSPNLTMEIRPQVGGTIAEVLVNEGQTVKVGTPLFKIDSALYEMKVSEAAAMLAMDRAGLQASRKKLDRYHGLAQKDLVSQAEWDELEMQVAKDRAAIELDEARLNAAGLDLEHCFLRSPIEGRIGTVGAYQGLLVNGGQSDPLTTIAQMDPLVVEFSITEKEYSTVPSWELPIEMTPLCSSGKCKKGAITFLDNSFDTKTGLLLIHGEVSNPDYSLRPGQSVRVRIPISVVSDAKLIQQKAVRYNQQGPYIYVVLPDSTVAIRQLVLGDEQGNEQVVLEGVDPDEQVIIDGHLRLFPGTKVEVKS